MRKHTSYYSAFLLLIMFFGPYQSAKAQYNGTFNALYFGRSIDAKTAALGSINTAVLNNAFVIHQNSSLLSFQEGYSIGYSHSSPYYLAEDSEFNYFGLSAKPFKHFAFGISRFTYENDFNTLKLSTIAVAYTFNRNYSIGINFRNLKWQYKRRIVCFGIGFIPCPPTNYEGEFGQWYLDFTTSARFHYPFLDEQATFIAGLTFENVFQQTMDVKLFGQQSKIELPTIITFGFNNQFVWNAGNNFLNEHISLSILGEYQVITNYDYRTRFSLGTQFGLNNILFLRAGYFHETLRTISVTPNIFYDNSDSRASLSEFTYGIGANIPVSKAFNIEQKIILSIDYTQMPQPRYPDSEIYDAGNFSTVSFSLRVVL